MARRRSNTEYGGQEIERLVAMRAGYVVVLYELWDGTTRDDEAGSLWLRAAFYNGEGTPPEDVPAAIEEAELSWSGWESLPGAETDEVISVLREYDREANKALSEHRMYAAPKEEDGYWARSLNADKEAYQQFLAAIDRVAVDYDDEEAWKTIELWRQRQLRAEEKEAHLV